MSCGGGHLRFPIGIKNRNLVKDIPMIILLQFGFSQFISFREENLWNFSQSEHIISPSSYVEYPTGTKNRYFAEDHPRNIPAKFGSNWQVVSEKKLEIWKVYRWRTTDDGRQVMAIVHLFGPGELKKPKQMAIDINVCVWIWIRLNPIDPNRFTCNVNSIKPLKSIVTGLNFPVCNMIRIILFCNKKVDI